MASKTDEQEQTAVDYLEHAVEDLKQAGQEAGEEVRSAIDSAMNRTREALDDLRSGAEERAESCAAAPRTAPVSGRMPWRTRARTRGASLASVRCAPSAARTRSTQWPRRSSGTRRSSRSRPSVNKPSGRVAVFAPSRC